MIRTDRHPWFAAKGIVKLNRNRHVLVLFVLTGLLSTAGFGQNKKIQVGDILQVRVFGHEEFSNNLVVQQNGTIDHPFLPNIPVVGLDPNEIRDVLTAQGLKYLGERPIVTVRFSEILSVSITVLGQVSVPGQYLVPKSATVQGAITQAGGYNPGAQIDDIRLLRETDSGSEAGLRVDLLKFMQTADKDLLPELLDGDVIIVPGRPGVLDVKVMGEVKKPDHFPYYAGENLLDFIYLAGGPTDKARMNKVMLVSPQASNGGQQIINLRSLIDRYDPQQVPVIYPGDVIIVPKQKTPVAKTVFNIVKDVATITSPILMALYYARRTN